VVAPLAAGLAVDADVLGAEELVVVGGHACRLPAIVRPQSLR
jgi:hypothetical protein